MKQRIDRRQFLRLSASLSTGAVLVACGGSGASTSPNQGGGAAEAPSAAPQTGTAATSAPAANTGKAQLLLWDGFVDDSDAMDELIAQFTQANPNIEIQREAQDTDQIRNVLRTALDAGQGPDVVAYDTGPGFAGVLAKAGLLLPLDDAYAKYGWDDRLFPIAKQRASFDGTAYGIGHEVEAVGVFYNRRIFEEQGLSEPKTHEELLQIADKLKGAGIIPIGFANQDKWPAGHTFSVFAGNIAGRDKLAQAISGEVPWNDPDFVQAIQIPFVEMNQAGYFIPDVNAVTYDDWNSLFYSGQTAMSLTGTWQVRSYSTPETMADPVGFFFYPPIQGKAIAPPSGLGLGYFISSKTQAPEAALQFLDFLFSEETAKFWVEKLNRIPPVQLNPADYQVTDLMRFTLETLQKGSDTMGYNIDVLTPDTFNTVMGDGFQEVLGGAKTAQQQADDLQKAMEEAKAQGKVFDITP